LPADVDSLTLKLTPAYSHATGPRRVALRVCLQGVLASGRGGRGRDVATTAIPSCPAHGWRPSADVVGDALRAKFQCANVSCSGNPRKKRGYTTSAGANACPGGLQQ